MLRCPRMTDAPVKTPSRTRRMVRKVTLGLVALVVVLAGIVVDSLLSAAWVVDDALLLAAAAVIVIALYLTRSKAQP